MDLENYYKEFLKNNAFPRQLTLYQPSLNAMHLEWNNQLIINFSSNDYLGLSKHPLLMTESETYLKLYGSGLSSSRLVTGNIPLYDKIESTLAKELGKPAALILASGYQTNQSVLEALFSKTIFPKKPLVFCDRYCHNSMLVMTQYLTRLIRFKHNDLTHLASLLEKYKEIKNPKFILAESIYSMDGDQTNLCELTSLAKKYKAFLYVDDAHAVGVVGKNGWGLAHEYANDIDIIMGTFSKALGSFGGYIACSETMRNYLINNCKGLIYSTALSPSILGSIFAAIKILPQLNEERVRVAKNAAKVRQFLKQRGLNYAHSTTHIIPWIIGDAEKTVYASELLLDAGILGATIRPPTVPKNQSRIRFCISAAHSDADIEHLLAALQKVEVKL